MDYFNLPKLTFDFNALEPYLDAQTMEIHYTKHHQTYATNLNKLTAGYDSFFQGKSIEVILSDALAIPEAIRQGVINHGGGFANHNLYWRILSPQGGGEPTGELAAQINQSFGSFEAFKQQLSQAAVSQFGSGWGWLVLNDKKALEIIQTSNQNSPLSLGKIPLMTIDVWEHAYYLNYQNRRPDFVDAIWNVFNWAEIEKNYASALTHLTLKDADAITSTTLFDTL